MHKIKSLVMVSLCLLIVACGTKEPEAETNNDYLDPIFSGDYQVKVPYTTNSARITHKASINTSDSTAIGKGSLEYSKKHFSVDEYVQLESQFLTDSLGELLARSSKEKPNGLNLTEPFNTGESGVVEDIVLLSDIYEYNWYKNDKVGGMTLTLYLNPHTGSGQDAKPVELSDEVLNTYITDTVTKLVSYVRTNIPEIGSQQPIYVLIFKTNGDASSSLPGTFIKEAYYEGATSSKGFSDIKEEWTLYPSKRASENSPATYEEFNKIKNSLWMFLGEDIKVIGTGFYRNGQLIDLNIEVGMSAKTYTEALAATQQVKSLLSTTFSSDDFNVTMTVTNDNGENFAVLRKERGSSKVTSILLK